MKYDLNRFLQAQERTYETALAEIRAGRKRSHWIWYIFPQIRGLGFSTMAQKYAIRDLEEAKAYMEEPVLRRRLLEISSALLGLESRDPLAVMGSPDDLKLRSSMTLFAAAAPEEAVFRDVLNAFYGGKADRRTLKILQQQSEEGSAGTYGG